MSSEKKLVVPHDLFPWKPAKEAGKAPQEKLIVAHAPHWHDGSKISTKNYNIMIAALPAVLMGISQYGAPALAVIAFAMACAMIWEVIMNLVLRRPIPIGDGSAALTGLLLGWMAFPAILVGLALQATLFQFGGLTSLGVNTLNMALPAVFVYYLFIPVRRRSSHSLLFIGSAVCGALALLISGVLIGLCLVFTGEAFWEVAQLTVAAHLPVMVVEASLTGFCVLFLIKVKPQTRAFRQFDIAVLNLERVDRNLIASGCEVDEILGNKEVGYATRYLQSSRQAHGSAVIVVW